MRYSVIGKLVFVLFLLCVGIVSADSEVYFQAADALGDDNGYGRYEYPTNPAFQPYKGLFDIVEFKVGNTQSKDVFFDTKFAEMTNPWLAPEGFIHQNLHIYIDAMPKHGATISPDSDINVTFPSEYAWDFCVKAVGWNNSELLTIEGEKTIKQKLRSHLLDDGRTIRVIVPSEFLPPLSKNWHYTVLVGSYDGFEKDFFRKIAQNSGEWVIGGGQGSSVEPRVLDLIASDKGKMSQIKQLGSFDSEKGILAKVYPLNVSNKKNFQKIILTGTFLIMLIFVGCNHRKLFDRYFK